MRAGTRLVGVLGSLVWLLGGVPAEAHLRDYVLNQAYYTTKQGEFEIEFWNDMYFPEADNDDTYATKHQIELEYGLTDHLQLAYYEVYTWDRAEDWERDAFKLETKYRFAEAGQWPVNVALYAEYANPNGPREAHSDVLEGKLILSRDVGPWNVVANLITEREINTHADWEFEYTAGLSYAVTPRTRLGLEVKQGLGDSDAFAFDGTEPLYVAPGIYTSLTPHLRVLFSPVFGMTRASDDLQLRSLVEVEF